MKPATRTRSRLVSPAGFALVLLLFLFMPFLSVSCDVPGEGSIGVDYNGAQLAVGAEPAVEIPQGLEDMARDLPGSAESDQPPPDPGVQVLAIIVAVVLVAGAALPFVPRLAGRVRWRMFGGAAVALVVGVLMIVTQAVARSNLTAQLTDDAHALGDDVPSAADISDQLIHTEVGFWLSLVVLFAIALGSVGYVYRDKIFPGQPSAGGNAGSVPIWRPDPDD